MVRGDLGLEREDAIGGCRGVGEPRQIEDALDVAPVGGADGLEVLEPVVALVGQRQPALHEERDVALRVAGIGLDVQADEPADAVALELAERAQQRRDRVDRVGAAELLRKRLGAELVDALGVHEARVQVADLARLASGFGIPRLFDDRADVLLGLLGDEVERAPARLVVGDLGAVEPGSVDVAEEVVLRADLSTELVERETGSGIGHPYRICALAMSARPPGDGMRADAGAPKLER